MSDQPSPSEPTTSASDREVEEPTDELRRCQLTDESVETKDPEVKEPVEMKEAEEGEMEPTSSSGQKAQDKPVKKRNKLTIHIEPLPKVPSYRARFLATPSTELEYNAVAEEMKMKGRCFDPTAALEAFKKMSKEMQDQMLKRPYMRRMLVVALHVKGNHNKTMDAIKKITNRKKCPVPMNEIQYIIRRLLSDEEDLDLNAHIDVLLAEEELKQRMLDSTEDPRFLKNFTKSLREDTKIECVDIRINQWNLDISFLEIKIGEQLRSKSFRYDNKMPGDEDQTVTALAEVSALLDVCNKHGAKITKLKLTIGGCEESKEFLKNFMELPCVLESYFETFELQNCGAFLSVSMIACAKIKCHELWITQGCFDGDNMDDFYGALKLFDKSVQKCVVTSKDVVHGDIAGLEIYGADPGFEVLTGIEEETGDKVVELRRTGRQAYMNTEGRHWQSVDCGI